MGDLPKSGRELLAEHVAAQRAGYRAVARIRPVSDGELAALAAEASARAATPPATSGVAPISGALPLAAKRAIAPGDRIDNPKIQDADVDKYRAPNFAAASWWKRANAAISARKTGDVLMLTLNNCCNALARRFNWGHGSARLSFETLAKEMGCCPETARKAIRYLQEYDVVNVLNTLIRRDDDNRLVRWTNLYLAPRPEQAPLEEPSGLSPQLSKLARAGAVLTRWASYFVGLVARDFGLNGTPLRRQGVLEPS